MRGEIGSRWLGPPTWLDDSILTVANWSRSEAILTSIGSPSVRRFALPALSDSLAPTHHLAAAQNGLIADQWFNSRISIWSANWDSLELSPIELLDTLGRLRGHAGSLIPGGGHFLTYALNRGVPAWIGDTMWFARLSDAVIQGYVIPVTEAAAKHREPSIVVRPPLFLAFATPYEVKPPGATRWQPVVRTQALAFAARGSEFALAQMVAPVDSQSGINLRTALVLLNRSTNDRDVLMVDGEIRSIGLTATRVFLTIAYADPNATRIAAMIDLPPRHQSATSCPHDTHD
jgi:hypothetical protein